MAFAKSFISFIWQFLSKHAFLVTLLFFIVAVGFLDENSYYQIFLQQEEIVRLQDKIKEQQDIYDRDTKLLEELETNPRAIEKIAREHYFMKRPNEDVYVFK